MALDLVNGNHNDAERPGEEPANGEKSTPEKEEKALEEQNPDRMVTIILRASLS